MIFFLQFMTINVMEVWQISLHYQFLWTKLLKFFIHWKQAKISNLNIYLIKCVLSHGYLDTLYVVMIRRIGGGDRKMWQENPLEIISTNTLFTLLVYIYIWFFITYHVTLCFCVMWSQFIECMCINLHIRSQSCHRKH